MQAWLTSQKTDSLTVSNLINQSDWKSAHSITADSGKVYQIVTLTTTAKYDDAAKTTQRYLTLVTQNGNTTGYIYDLYGNEKDLNGKADNAITGFNNKSISGFTGEVTLSSWRNSIKKNKVYANGENTLVKTLAATPSTKKTVQSTGKRLDSCIDWYWVYSIDGDEFARFYAYTTCDGPGDSCAQESFRDGKGTLSVRVNCNVGGGSNGQDYINKVVNPCLHKMVDSTISKDINTQISGFINSVFGISSSVNIVYVDVNTLPTGVEGQYQDYSLDSYGNINLNIALN